LTTLTLPGLADLREQVDAVLMDDDRQSRLVDELETLRSSDIGYIGPDPEPVTRRMVQALAGQGITTTFTTAGGPAIVPLQGSNGITWGLTNRSDDPTEKQRIFVSELTSPRGRAIVLAHEAGHALTWDRWAGIDFHRAEDAGNQGLCIICGERVGPDWLYALLSGRPFDRRSNAFDIFFGVGSPSPTFGHPKCVLIAATFCPHLRRQEHPAQTQDGRKLTHEELKELAHRKVPA
jgi:hypothetical protein